MSKKKETKYVAVNKSVTEKDLMDQMGECSSTLLLPNANIHVPKDKFKEIIERFDSLEEVKNYLLGLEGRSYSLETLAKNIKKAANEYGKLVLGNNFVFHASLIDTEMGKMSFVSNLSNDTAGGMMELMFRNCQMSPLYRDVIVGVYLLCKKAGIDKGDFTPKI